MKLSIVATLFQSAQHIEEFHRRAGAAARSLVGDDFEIVLVNDGSPDQSLDLAVRVAETDSHVTVVDLSRNFGHHKAMMTGLAHSTGQLVFLIDSDLEEEPEWLRGFAEQLNSESCDVVYGVQARRKGSRFERWSGTLFYRAFRAITGLALPDNVVVARLMSRRYVNALLAHEEREVFIAGLWLITGFAQHAQVVEKHDLSPTTYTLGRKIAQFVNSVTSFSNAPLVWIFYVGLVISLIAGSYSAYVVFHWLFLARPPSGWTSLVASVWLLGGLIILFLGVLGVYMSKIFSESKHRPYTIVRHVYRKARPTP